MQNNEARGGSVVGRVHFQQQHQQSAEHELRVLERAARRVLATTRRQPLPGSTRNRAWLSEWYAQDTWQASRASPSTTARVFLWYQPYWRVDDQVANFDPARFDPARAPRLYQPALVNGVTRRRSIR